MCTHPICYLFIPHSQVVRVRKFAVLVLGTFVKTKECWSTRLWLVKGLPKKREWLIKLRKLLIEKGRTGLPNVR